MNILAWFYWNPEKIAFKIPVIDHPIAWYGILFVLGFVVGYVLLIPMFQYHLEQNQKLASKVKNKTMNLRDQATMLVDRLTWFSVIGTIVGARLGHIFLYEWPYYQMHPEEIIKIWKGGLASHGGALGVLLALILYKLLILKNYPELSLRKLLDMIVIPSALVALCIRIGNFINQEILGTPSDLPWAVLFGASGERHPIPRHPVQLYEALAYLGIFCLLVFLWKSRKERLKPGLMTGIFFIWLFSARFIFEFFKQPQSMMIDESWIMTGQLLSLPFIIAGIYLCLSNSTNQIPQDKLNDTLAGQRAR